MTTAECFRGLSREEQAINLFEAFSGMQTASPPSLVSATIGSNGTTFSLVFDEIVAFGAGGNTGWTIAPSGGAATLVYASGAGTTTLVYTISRTIALTETATVSYVQPGDGVENVGGTDLASIVARAVTNSSVYDADAINWFETRVPAAGGTTVTATRLAVNTFTLAAKSNGYWTKLNRINLFCGDQLAACLVPLKVGAGAATDTNVNFVGGDYSQATGLTGNGTTKYLNTGLLANALTLNDTRLAVYNRTSGATGGGAVIAATDGTNVLNLLAPYSDGTVYSDHYTVAGGRLSAAITGAAGCIAGTRTAANAHKIYRNGVEIATSATTGGALPALELFIFAQNGSGVPNLRSGHALASYAIGAGFTAQQEADYAADEQAFQTLLGRQV